jgi:glutamine amidotransferase
MNTTQTNRTQANTAANTVVVLDYGTGNVRSVAQAVLRAAQLSHKTVDVQVTHCPDTIRQASRVVLPGQGAMPDCMAALKAQGLLEVLLEVARNKPLLGICVGQQMLLEHSEEGDCNTLGLFTGQVVRFAPEHTTQRGLKVPHMGWNTVRQTQAHPLWQGIPNHAWFYFVHSYHAQGVPLAHQMGVTEHGQPFTCAMAKDNIFATQFHPEKSAHDGLQLYANFLNWQP